MRRRLVVSGICEEGCSSPPTELFGVQDSPQQSYADYLPHTLDKNLQQRRVKSNKKPSIARAWF